MKRLYITSHSCSRDTIRSDRYWIADDEDSTLKHIGVCDIDKSFLNLLVDSLNCKVIYLNILDEEFKKLMLEEGYKQ
jgi:hypothetical protein